MRRGTATLVTRTLLVVAVALATTVGVAASAGAKPPPWAPPGSGGGGTDPDPALDLIAAWDEGIVDGICYSISAPIGTADDLDAAVQDWATAVGGLTLTNTAQSPCATEVVIVYRNGGGSTQGTTRFSSANGFLTGAEIVIRGKFAGTPNDVARLAHITRHEFGHALGLGHWNVADEYLMSPYLNGNVDINACEAEAVRAAQRWYFAGDSVPTPPSSGDDPYECDPAA